MDDPFQCAAKPATEDQPVTTVGECEHFFVSEHRPGHLIYWVRQCAICHEVDWDNLDEQVRELILLNHPAVDALPIFLKRRDPAEAARLIQERLREWLPAQGIPEGEIEGVITAMLPATRPGDLDKACP
jgi:hypothetical protein